MSKKVTAKKKRPVSKKVNEVAAPVNTELFLSEEEMRHLADASNNCTTCELEMKLQEQYEANCRLKKENLLLEVKVVEREIDLAQARKQNLHQAYVGKNMALKNLVESTKAKYNIKDTSPGLKYDNRTGKILTK